MLLRIEEAQKTFAALASITTEIEAAGELMVETLVRGNRIFVCGNGGSAAEGQHFVTELVGRYKSNRRSLPAVWLGGDTGQMSCIANDFSWDDVFARPLIGLAEEGDLLLALSTSGRSSNILGCLKAANAIHIPSIALLGNGGGDAASLATHPIVVPATGTARVQEAHLFLIHTFCDAIESAL
jgi:D-sedoheptulose 7-phosphate isomerase